MNIIPVEIDSSGFIKNPCFHDAELLKIEFGDDHIEILIKTIRDTCFSMKFIYPVRFIFDTNHIQNVIDECYLINYEDIDDFSKKLGDLYTLVKNCERGVGKKVFLSFPAAGADIVIVFDELRIFKV